MSHHSLKSVTEHYQYCLSLFDFFKMCILLLHVLSANKRVKGTTTFQNNLRFSVSIKDHRKPIVPSTSLSLAQRPMNAEIRSLTTTPVIDFSIVMF